MFFNKGIAGANSSSLPVDWQEVTLLFKGIGKILPGPTRRLAGFYSSLRRKCQDYFFLCQDVTFLLHRAKLCKTLPEGLSGFKTHFSTKNCPCSIFYQAENYGQELNFFLGKDGPDVPFYMARNLRVFNDLKLY